MKLIHAFASGAPDVSVMGDIEKAEYYNDLALYLVTVAGNPFGFTFSFIKQHLLNFSSMQIP